MATANPKKSIAMNKAVSAVIYDGMKQPQAARQYKVKLNSLRNRLCYVRKQGNQGKGLHPALMIMKEAQHG